MRKENSFSLNSLGGRIVGGARGIDVRDIINIAIFVGVFVGLWQLVVALEILPKIVMPSPTGVMNSFNKLVGDNSIFVGIGMTLFRLAIAFGISIGIGGAVGLVMVRFPRFGKTMSSFAVGLLTFPSIAWVPFSILLFGYNDFGIFFVVIMASVFSIMISTFSALRNVPPLYVRAAKNMGAHGFGLFRHVMIPAATPSLITGLKQGWSFAWHALIGAEILIIVANTHSLGQILYQGREFLQINQVVAIMITLFIIGIVFDRVLFNKIEERVRTRWGLNQQIEQ